MLCFSYPFVFGALGLWIAFSRFWHGFDAISGDLGDARFNAYVLEHTWLWLQGQHELFNMPMFYPNPNTYAYSDFMLGFAPIYWIFRAMGLEILLAFQWWLVVGVALNFVTFYFAAKKLFSWGALSASLAAFVFAFSLPRITHMEHAQMMVQFYLVLSVAGALLWWKNPTSRTAPWLFAMGAVLQFISAFYFFWFWVWALGIYAFYIFKSRERRNLLRVWWTQVPRSAVAPFVAGGLLASPFLLHYAQMARDFGRRDWVSISNTVPRLYSWLNLPNTHWEWDITPMKEWIATLPMQGEHYLSFGLLTWMGMIGALIWIYRRQPQWKFLAIPVLVAFVFTITSGRFSTWVFMSYLFPGGGAIRAVGRIQIFLLMFWAVMFVLLLRDLWAKQPRDRIIAAVMVIGLLGESFYLSDWTFSLAENRKRMNAIAAQIPADCGIIVNPGAFRPMTDIQNVDAVMFAMETGRATANGYSGHAPKNYNDPLEAARWESITELNGKKVCKFQ